MVRSVKKSALVVLVSAAVMALAPTVAAQAAPLPINRVACTRSDFLKINVHQSDGFRRDYCYANRGTSDEPFADTTWLHRIDTGNNRVQWYGDGRWQPATPIPKNTAYTFPNHPGGVRIEKIWIE